MKQSRNIALTRILAGLLIAAQVGAMTACVEDTGKTPDITDVGSEAVTTASETESDEITLDSVLADYSGISYDGSKFRVVTSNIVNSSITLQQAPYEEENGDRINDALFKRDGLIENTFGIEIEYTLIEPDAEFKLYETVSKEILADEDICDLIFGNMQVYAKNFIKSELIRNIASIDEINLEQPWWHQTANRDLKVGDTMLLATGDITPRYIYGSFIILFNQKLFTDYGWEYPYEAVREGKWTMDMLLSYVKGAGQDLNNDGKMKYDDFYGFTNEGWAYPFLNGFNETVISTTEGEPTFNFESETLINKAQKIAELFELDDTFYKAEKTQYDMLDIFADDRALLSSQTATNLSMLREMDSDYGVLPLPKYDKNQDQYYSFVNGYTATAVMIPITVTDTSMVGNITEAMAAASRFLVTPEAYEVTLLTKQTRDEESIEMLRLAAESAMYDMNVYFDWGTMQSTVNTVMLQNIEKLTSNIAKVRDKAIKAVNETLELFKNAK